MEVLQQEVTHPTSNTMDASMDIDMDVDLGPLPEAEAEPESIEIVSMDSANYPHYEETILTFYSAGK